MQGRPWTNRENALLRRLYTKRSVADVAKRLNRTPSAVMGHAKKIGVQSGRSGKGRVWTAEERRYVLAFYQKIPTADIAVELGRTSSQIHQMADRLGIVARNRRMTDEDLATIRKMAIAGACNRCIGRAVGIDKGRARRLRRHLGLPAVQSGGAVATCEKCRRRVQATTQRQCEAAGVRCLAEIKSLEFHKYAVAYGWPDDLRPRAVQILNTLWDRGPQTRRQLAEATGMPWKGSRKSLTSNDPEGSYLAHLMRRGLVVCLGKVVQHPEVRNIRGDSSGTNTCLYSIAPGVSPGCYPATESATVSNPAQPTEV